MHIKLSIVAAAFGAAAPCLGSAALNPADAVKLALESSPLVRARLAELEGSRRRTLSVGSADGPQIELGPGVGFTNSTSLISQSLDIFGERTALVKASQAESDILEAHLAEAKLSAIQGALEAVSEVLKSAALTESARQRLSRSQAIVEAVSRRVEAGEAPAVAVTRAKLEAARAEQELVRSEAEAAQADAALKSLLGRTDGAAVSSWISFADLRQTPAADAPAVLIARAKAASLQAQIQAVRSESKPRLSAGIAADFWSLDRSRRFSDSLGFQLTLRAPLFDRGRNRLAVEAADFEAVAGKADTEEAVRQANVEQEQARLELASAQRIAQTYAQGLIPESESMLNSMLAGFEAGLVTFLEVLEAQRAVHEVRREEAEAAHALRKAELRVLVSTSQVLSLAGGQA